MTAVATASLFKFAGLVAEPDIPLASASAAGSVFVAAVWERWEECENDLKTIRRYQDDWDGYGAPSPDPSLIDASIRFMHRLRQRDVDAPPFRVALSPNGTVFFEWQDGKNYAQAEVVDRGRVEWMDAPLGEKPSHFVEALPGVGSDDCKDSLTKIAPVAVTVDFRY